MWGTLRRLFRRIGSDPANDADLRLKKRVLVAFAAMIGPAAVVWGGRVPGFRRAAGCVDPAGLCRCLGRQPRRVCDHPSVPGVPARAADPHPPPSVLSPSGSPRLRQRQCGDPVVVARSLGAMLMSGRRRAVWWFAGFVGLVVASQLVQPSVRLDNNLTRATVPVFFGMNVVGVSAIAFITLHYFVGQRDFAFGMLEADQAKSEGLLLNILPRQVAAVLKDDRRIIAEHYSGISVLFADVVGFTPMSQKLEPEAMVALLSDVFSRFDRLAAEHGCA